LFSFFMALAIFWLSLRNGGFIDNPVLRMPSGSLPDLEEEILVIPDSVGLPPDVLDQTVRSFQRTV